MTQDIRDQAVRLLLRQIKSTADPATITDDRSVEDLGMSSLDLVHLMYDLEEALGIELDPEEMMDIGTVGDLVGALVDKVSAKAVG